MDDIEIPFGTPSRSGIGVDGFRADLSDPLSWGNLSRSFVAVWKRATSSGHPGIGVLAFRWGAKKANKKSPHVFSAMAFVMEVSTSLVLSVWFHRVHKKAPTLSREGFMGGAD
jgi:hypothetical protein